MVVAVVTEELQQKLMEEEVKVVASEGSCFSDASMENWLTKKDLPEEEEEEKKKAKKKTKKKAKKKRKKKKKKAKKKRKKKNKKRCSSPETGWQNREDLVTIPDYNS